MNGLPAKLLSFFLASAALCSFPGCSSQDFGAPAARAVLDPKPLHPTPYLNNNNMDRDALLRSRRLAKVLAEWKTEDTPQADRDYSIGTDDVIEIAVLSLERPGEVSKLIRKVDERGNVTLPWVGGIAAHGKTTTELQRSVVTAFDGKFLKNPQVTARVSQFLSSPVLVTGAVTKPGVYYLSRNKRSILEILAQADGLNERAGDELVIIRASDRMLVDANSTDATDGTGAGLTSPRIPALLAGNAVDPPDDEAPPPGNLLAIDLRQLIDEGDMRLNVWVQKGDMLYVPPASREYIYVLGYVQRPGAIQIESGGSIGALQAVAMSGGLTTSARAENSCLLRKSSKGQTLIPVNLPQIAKGTKPPLLLAAGDTLIVGSSFFARLSEFVKPGVGIGANYAVPMP